MSLKYIGAVVAAMGAFTASDAGASTRVNSSVALEPRLFAHDASRDSQPNGAQLGLILTSDVSYRSRDRNTRIEFEPYLRLDNQDSERSYLDIREASITYRIGDWDILAGVSSVFWGVNESRNVVDVINQFDTVEDIDEGEKLGQPMIRLSYRNDVGVFEGYYLPYFREREFVGPDGRLDFGIQVDEELASYQRSGDETAGDIAFRFTKRFGDIDFGFHAFHGTHRTPLLIPSEGDTFRPFYQRLRQAGVDVQYTTGAWLWKLETVVANADGQYVSSVSGLEYTMFDIKRSGWDVGLIAEYLYDDRDISKQPLTIFDDDVFLGTRITLNDIQDTEFLGGVIVDLNTDAVQGSIEFQRRIGNTSLLEIEAKFFTANDDRLIKAVDNDDVVTLRYTYYF